MIHVYIHYPTRKEARKISRLLLEKHLASCVNFIDQEDLYWWEGKIVNTKGVVTLVVTKKKNFKKIEQVVTQHHSFKVPCILELPISRASKPYEKWLNKTTK